MQILPLYLEITTKTLVFSQTDATPFIIPLLNTEDGLDVRVRFLRRKNLYSRPLFEELNTSSYSIRVSLGIPGTEYAAGNISTVVADTGGKEVQGYVSLATAGITTITTANDPADTTLEIKGTDTSGNPIHAQFAVKVKKSVSIAAALVPVQGDTALGVLQANRLYVAREGAAGDAIILTSPLGIKFRLAVMDDGAGGAYLDTSQIT